MRRHFLTVLIFSACQLFADENEPMVIDSGEAGYNGKTISLSGHVVIEHELGKLEADQMELTPEVINAKIQAKRLAMEKNVSIDLQDGGQLCCSKAEVDFNELQGDFHGSPEQEYVTYTEFCADKTGSIVPVVVKSRDMKVKIAREKDKASASLRSALSEITAENDVTVNYNDDFMAAADHADYQRLDSNESSHSAFLHKHMPGLISLRADKEGGVCQITNRNGDMISADHLCIDTAVRQLSFAYPKGALYMSSDEGGGRNRIDFSSDTLSWEDKQNQLTLREHVNIHQHGMGTLISDKDVKLKQDAIDGKKKLCAIESTGTTVLTYAEQDKDIMHTLTCYGTVCVDHKQLKTTMESPKDNAGNVPQGQQVSFQDYMGEIYADKLTIEYVMHNHALKPVRLFLEGHVRVLNRCSIDPDCKGDFLQFALADQVEYTPQAKEISLAATGSNRVLFYDKTNNLQVSAPALKIRRDESTKKESIQGVGNVRFSFIKQEMDAINKQFGIQ